MTENTVPQEHPPCEMLLRLDERFKNDRDTALEIKNKLAILNDHVQELAGKVAVIDSREMAKELHECSKAIVEIDKRVGLVEDTVGRGRDRWNQISAFVVQLAWVVLAAWLLTKLNLQPPTIP